ncbi:hypothetical protein CRUP_034814 [Coryphaenoides rupestris]|nr:hypothetical protein CRUP_034814 [Coryphaenoides rupestris]
MMTRILVTHGISFLPQVDNIVVMVTAACRRWAPTSSCSTRTGPSPKDVIDEEEPFPDDALSNHTDMVDNERWTRSVRRHACSQRKSAEPPAEKKPRKTPGTEKLIQAETTETGRVKMQVFRRLRQAWGLVLLRHHLPAVRLPECSRHRCQTCAEALDQRHQYQTRPGTDVNMRDPEAGRPHTAVEPPFLTKSSGRRG